MTAPLVILLGNSAPERIQWNTWLSENGGHLLQCTGWADFKATTGWRSLRFAVYEKDSIIAGAQVLLRRLPLGLGAIAYLGRGPLGDPAALDTLWPSIHTYLRRRRAIALICEPDAPPGSQLTQAMRRWEFSPLPTSIQPRTTIHIDLTMDLPTLSARQKPKTRYNIGLAVRHGVTVRPASLDEWDDIFPLFEETSRRDGFPIHTKGYYAALLSGLDGRPEAGGLARLTVAEHQGHVLAAIIVAAFGSTAIYLHGASRSEGRQHMPTYAIQWEAIQWARAHGCRVYDLWGIPDEAGQGMEPEEDQRGGLWGVYRFKRGFGGEIVRYAGALVAVYAPRRYWLWNVALPRYRRLLLRRLNMPPDTNA